jgi:hypothetical protein
VISKGKCNAPVLAPLATRKQGYLSDLEHCPITPEVLAALLAGLFAFVAQLLWPRCAPCVLVSTVLRAI